MYKRQGKALMVNNADWLLDLNYLQVLREVGACFSVNRMLTAECYKPVSYTHLDVYKRQFPKWAASFVVFSPI